MSEKRTQTRYLPLRVRIRPSSDYNQHGREAAGFAQEHAPFAHTQSVGPHIPDLSHATDAERQTQQIKELLRLCTILRSDLSPDEILRQVAASTVACTGFRSLTINLLDENGKVLVPVAFAGIPDEEQRILYEHPFPVDALTRMMSQDFRISQSYLISHEHNGRDETTSVDAGREEARAGGWHADDMLIVPLFSPREQRILGYLSLHERVGGNAPTLESIEVVELFASKAAIAIDNMQLSQERVALEEGIATLREDLEQVRRGNLLVRVRSVHPRLETAVEAINKTIEEVNSILLDMRGVTQAVDEHIHNVQHNSEQLAYDTRQQELQVRRIAQIIGEFARMMNTISASATNLIQKALEGVEVTNKAQRTTDRAVEGMSAMRDMTLQSARTMKALGESGQEINATISMSSDLTMRMHLLALNAAIEATRSGEHGRSFVPIAQEIRTLAMQSAEAARKVEAYIHTIQQEASAVSQSIEQNTQQAVMQTELVTEAGVALDAIGIVTAELTTLIQGIYTTAENQSQSSQIVVNSINETLRMTDDVTRHMQEMQQSTERLVEVANSLRARLSRVRLDERD